VPPASAHHRLGQTAVSAGFCNSPTPTEYIEWSLAVDGATMYVY
jgi:hypothetical protein